jgi:hypothetical protein
VRDEYPAPEINQPIVRSPSGSAFLASVTDCWFCMSSERYIEIIDRLSDEGSVTYAVKMIVSELLP